MAVQKTLVDTSAWIETLRVDGDPEVRATVLALTAEGDAVFCDMVRLELWNGARGSREQRMLRDLERELEFVETSTEVWDLATNLAEKCRRNGLTVPAADLLIAASAAHHGLELVHTDRHFDQISRLLAP